MRGSTLFDNIIFEEVIAPKERKGRNNSLHIKRNECLMDRYFYYAKIIGLNYPKTLEELEKEFWLCMSTIPQIMEKPDNQLYLRRLKMQQPAKSFFVKKWPHFSWEIKLNV